MYIVKIQHLTMGYTSGGFHGFENGFRTCAEGKTDLA
jgi:hypothetical protein